MFTLELCKGFNPSWRHKPGYEHYPPVTDNDEIVATSEPFCDLTNAMKDLLTKDKEYIVEYIESFDVFGAKITNFEAFLDKEFKEHNVVDIQSLNDYLGLAFDDGFYLWRYARVANN